MCVCVCVCVCVQTECQFLYIWPGVKQKRQRGIHTNNYCEIKVIALIPACSMVSTNVESKQHNLYTLDDTLKCKSVVFDDIGENVCSTATSSQL